MSCRDPNVSLTNIGNSLLSCIEEFRRDLKERIKVKGYMNIKEVKEITRLLAEVEIDLEIFVSNVDNY